ncbi:helix-turn-helix domain-containing protein [Aeromicrobium sp. UC242_57]|uniref:helix-turn-helix domain-containing protein n=1 Tax=Aeromicrobium sp. UC242_57 TaxID=3374624 RepID=UPI00379A7EDC
MPAPPRSLVSGVHEQTIRQRMRRLKHLFGDRLVNPPQALALLMALRQSRALNLLTDKNTHAHDTKPPPHSRFVGRSSPVFPRPHV